MENKIKRKDNIPPINILFNHLTSEYNLYYSDFKNNAFISYNLSADLVSKDALVNMTRRIINIKFIGLPTLIEFCKNEKLYNLQIVFEWINFFIYKEERKVFDPYIKNNSLISGIKSLIQKLSCDREECHVKNGFKFIDSDLRNLLIKLILQTANNIFTSSINDFDSFLNQFMLYIITLNFEDASNLLKEVMNSKEKKKITSDNMTFFIIFEPVISHFSTATNSSYFSLNSTVKNLIETLEKIENPQISYVISFIQQKLNTKINEFLKNHQTSILLKLIYILKFSSAEEITNQLEILEEFYMNSGCIEALILIGNSTNSITLLENYINKTDDLLVSYILSKFFVDSKESFYTKCESELFESFNRMMMFNERIQLTQKLNEIIAHMTRTSMISLNSPSVEKKINFFSNSNNCVELVLNCFYCNTKIYKDKMDQFRNLSLNNKESNEYIDFCPKCIKKLPSCAICLCPIELNIPIQKSKNLPMNYSNTELKREKLDAAEDSKWPELKYVWCTKCRHGGHLDHLKEWFTDLFVCPVADCNCICLEYNHIIL